MNKLLIGAAFIALALGTAPVAAQMSPPPGVDQGTTPMPRVRTPPVIRSPVHVMVMPGPAITRDDFVRQVRVAFEEVDANHDGFVTRRELAAHHGRLMGGMHGPMPEGAGGHGGQAGDHGMGMPDPAMMFDRLDTNHDGVISREEFMSAHTRMHARMMVMRRGEMGEGMGQMNGSMPAMGEGHGMHFLAHLFDAADANHDRRVSLHEAESAALAHFDRMDLNHDGRLTPDERREAHVMMRARPRG